jgi:hypothetical protein
MKKAGVPGSRHDRRRFVLPRKLFEEYRAYVACNTEPPAGMTYLEAFMRKKGLLDRERQISLMEEAFYIDGGAR